MKNKFALSFGIALIVMGVFNCFFESTNVIMFGISISAFVFSIISMLFATKLSEKYELICIFPFVILLVFFCYSNSLMDIPLIRNIVNSRITSILTFVSFGLSFVSEFINDKNYKLQDRIRHMSLINEMLDYTILIQQTIVDYRTEKVKEKVELDITTEKFLSSLENLYKEKVKKANMESKLLDLQCDMYKLDDFDKVYTDNTEAFKYKRK